MAIDFRNPLANHGDLLTRLRNMIGRSEPRGEPGGVPDGVVDGPHDDRVSLSGDAQVIAEEMRAGTPASKYDEARVTALKQAIATGTFRIDTARIADKLRLQNGDY